VSWSKGKQPGVTRMSCTVLYRRLRSPRPERQQYDTVLGCSKDGGKGGGDVEGVQVLTMLVRYHFIISLVAV
jgi:hypothetical protein